MAQTPTTSYTSECLSLYHTSGIWQRCGRARRWLTETSPPFGGNVVSLSWARAPSSCKLGFMQISEVGRCRALVAPTSEFESFRFIRMTTRTVDGRDQSSCFFSRQHSSYIGMWKAGPFHIATCRRESSLWWLSCKGFSDIEQIWHVGKFRAAQSGPALERLKFETPKKDELRQ